MEDIISYKCPCCGAALKFDSQQQELKCHSCNNLFPIETLKQFNEADTEEDNQSFDWGDFNKTTFEPEENIKPYICQSCGAEIIAEETTGATTCPYCDSVVVLSDRITGALKPDGVIPFKIDESKLKDIFKQFCKGKFFLPKKFLDEKKIKETKGIYVPFWLFDCNVNASINYNGVIVTHRSDSKYVYTITDHFLLKRSGTASFEKVPVDGSLKMDDTLMEAIEPFDYGNLVAFDTGYLSGFLADKFDVDAKTSISRANERVKQSVIDEFKRSTMLYTGVTYKNSNINTSKGNVSYVLLPVWILNAKYKDKIYTYAINGQTGKMVGELPVDWGKFFKLFGILGVIFSLIAYLIYLLL